jgi:hypothetical protein
MVILHAYILTIHGIPDEQLSFVDVDSNSHKIVDTVFGVGGTNYSGRPFLFRNLIVGFNGKAAATH